MSNFLLLNAGEGYRIKSYGPKCLLNLANGESVLDRQIRIINSSKKNNIYLATGFCANKVDKACSLPSFCNEDHQNYNQAFSVISLLEKFRIKESAYVVFGDTVFADDSPIGNQKDEVSTVFYSDKTNNNQIGMTHTNGNLKYMMWGLSPKWNEICYFDNNMIEFILDNKSRYHRSFLVEVINDAIDSGLTVLAKDWGDPIIDIDKLSDLEIANTTFGIK